jgi:hypothetical protein
MPDLTFQTVSASQFGALYDISHFGTKWELFQRFKTKLPIDVAEHERMMWGKKMQPLILEVLAHDRRFEIHPNAEDTYIRRGLIGCTRDAEIIDPSKGRGALEIKCVFDYKIWGERWDLGERIPLEYEMQLQAQMGVGDGITPYPWGIFAVWVCGQMQYFEREFKPEVWDRMQSDAAAFFADLAADRAPNPLGAPVEYAWIKAAFPVREKKVIATEDIKITEAAQMFEYAQRQESFHKKLKEQMRTRLMIAAEDADTLNFPFGSLYIKVDKRGSQRLSVYLRDDIPSMPDILNPAAYEELEKKS